MVDNLAKSAEDKFLRGDLSGARELLVELKTTMSGDCDIRVLNNIACLESTIKISSKKQCLAQLTSMIRLHDDGEGCASECNYNVKLLPKAACIMFNIALLKFHQCQYGKASCILLVLFLKISSFELPFSFRVCFLLIDTLLKSFEEYQHVSNLNATRRNFVTTALDSVMVYLSNNLKKDSNGDPASSFPASARDLLSLKAMLYQGKIDCFLGRDCSSAVSQFNQETIALLRSLSQVKDPRELLQLRQAISTASLCGTEPASDSSDCLSVIEYQSLLFMKAQIAYSKNDFRSSLVLLSDVFPHLTATSSLHSRLSTYLSQPSLPDSIYSTSLSSANTSVLVDSHQIIGRILYFNNIACVQARLGRKNLSCLYFGKALIELSNLESVSDPDSMNSLLLPSYIDDILYNSGLSYLMNDLPRTAFDCFCHMSDSGKENPLYWLRLADCCIQMNASRGAGSNADTDETHEQLHPYKSNSGAPADLCYFFRPQVKGRVLMRYPMPIDQELQRKVSEEHSNLCLTISFLLRAIRMSLALQELCLVDDDVLAKESFSETDIPTISELLSASNTKTASSSKMLNEKAGSEKSIRDFQKQSASVFMENAPSNRCRLNEVKSVPEAANALLEGLTVSDEFLESCYLKLTYAYVSIDEPVLALRAVRSFLRHSLRISTSGSFMLRMYAADALCHIGDFAEALLVLEPTYLFLPEVTYQDREIAASSVKPGDVVDQSSVVNGDIARICTAAVTRNNANHGMVGNDESKKHFVEAVILTNKSVMLCIQGQLAEAQHLLESIVSSNPTYAPAVRNLVYVLLRRRDHFAAAATLQRLCTQMAPQNFV